MEYYMVFVQVGFSESGPRLRYISGKAWEEIEENRDHIPMLSKMVKPCYNADYFQNGVVRRAILIRGNEPQEVREYISEHFYDGGTIPQGGRIRHIFDKKRLVFPMHFDQDRELLPIEWVSEGIVGDDVCYVETEDPVVYALLTSKMFFDWIKTNRLVPYGFPGPPKGDVPAGLAACVEELQECHKETMQSVRKYGGSYIENVPEKTWAVLERLNNYVDAMYPGYQPGMDRTKYLHEFLNWKSLKSRQRMSYPFHPKATPRQLPLLMALLDSNEPLLPVEAAKKAGVFSDYFGPIYSMVKGGKDGSRKLVREVGSRGNRRYEPSVDYEEFFREWIQCWLPADQQERTAVWTTAKDFTRETAFLMPDQYEFRTYLELLHMGPVTSKVLFTKAGGGRLMDKNLLRRDDSGKWEAAWPECEVRAGALRKIFSAMHQDVFDVLAHEMEHEIED